MSNKYEQDFARRQEIARERLRKEKELLEQRAKERREKELADQKERDRKEQEIKEKKLQEKKRLEEEAKIKVEEAQSHQKQTDRHEIQTEIQSQRPRNNSTVTEVTAPLVTRCIACGMKIAPTITPIEFKNQKFHENCFKCSKCSKKIGKNSFTETANGEPLCEECSKANTKDTERERELRLAQKYFQNIEIDRNRKPFTYKVTFFMENETGVSLEFRHREFQYEELTEDELKYLASSKEIKNMEFDLKEKLQSNFPALQKISDETLILLRFQNLTFPLSSLFLDSEIFRKENVDIILVQKDQLASLFPAIYFALEAQNLALENQFERALELCNQAISIEKINFFLINLRATIYLNLKKTKEAIEDLKNQTWRTGFGKPHLRIGALYFNEKKYEDACIHFYLAGSQAGVRARGGRQILENYGRKSLWAQPLNLLTWFTPLVVIRNIFSFLDFRSLLRCSRVCVQFRDIASDNLLWRKLCIENFLVNPKLELENFKEHFIHLKTESDEKGMKVPEYRYFRYGSGNSYHLLISPTTKITDLQLWLVDISKLPGTPVAFFLHTHPEHLISIPYLLNYAVSKTFFGKDEVLNIAVAEKAFCKNCLEFFDEDKNTENSCECHTGNLHFFKEQWKVRTGFWDCCKARYSDDAITKGCGRAFHKKDEQYVQFIENLNGLCKREGNIPINLSQLPKDPLHFELWKKMGQK